MKFQRPGEQTDSTYDLVIAGGVAATVDGYGYTIMSPDDGSHRRMHVWLSDGVGGFTAPANSQPPLTEQPLVEAETELTFVDDESGDTETVMPPSPEGATMS